MDEGFFVVALLLWVLVARLIFLKTSGKFGLLVQGLLLGLAGYFFEGMFVSAAYYPFL